MSWPAGQPKSDPAHSYIHWRAERLPPPCLLGVLQFASSHLFLLVVFFSVSQESGIRHAKSLAQLPSSVQWMTERRAEVSRCAAPWRDTRPTTRSVAFPRQTSLPAVPSTAVKWRR